FGVLGISGHAQREGIEAVLVGAYERLERTVQIRREPAPERLVLRHCPRPRLLLRLPHHEPETRNASPAAPGSLPRLRGASTHHLALQPVLPTRTKGIWLRMDEGQTPTGRPPPAIQARVEPAWWRLFSMKIRPISRPPRRAPAR